MIHNVEGILIAGDVSYSKPIGKVETPFNSKIMIGSESPYKIKPDISKGFEREHISFIRKPTSLIIHNESETFGSYYRAPKGKPHTIPYNSQILIGMIWLTAFKVGDRVILAVTNDIDSESEYYLCMLDELMVGRESELSVVDKSESVSKDHLKMKFGQTNFTITDWRDGNGSTNGTWVRFTKIECSNDIELRVGEKIFVKSELVHKIEQPKVITHYEEVVILPTYAQVQEQLKAKMPKPETVKIDALKPKQTTVKIDSSFQRIPNSKVPLLKIRMHF